MVSLSGKHVPGSYAQKLIKGIIVRYGMPAFWITINPPAQWNPLVVILAGVEYSGDIFTVLRKIREKGINLKLGKRNKLPRTRGTRRIDHAKELARHSSPSAGHPAAIDAFPPDTSSPDRHNRVGPRYLTLS